MGPQAPGRRRSPTSPRRSRPRSSTCSWRSCCGRRERTGIATVVIGGGVAANSSLRAHVLDGATRPGLRAVLPSPALCTDNAAMVAGLCLVAVPRRRPDPAGRRRRPRPPHRVVAGPGRRGACPAGARSGTVSTRRRGVLTRPAARTTTAEPLEEAQPMNLQPLEDRIVVRPAEAEEMTVSGLVIPDTAKEKPQQGEVLAVGPGRRAENRPASSSRSTSRSATRRLLEVRRHRDHARRRGRPHPQRARRARQGARVRQEVQEVVRE